MPPTEPTAGSPRRHVVLIGLPGAGKTTIGRALAKQLGRRFVDLDMDIEQSFDKSVSQIFAEDGEGAFRAAEAAASARLAAADDALVIAPGGGWVVNEAATAHLRGNARIIYLRVSPGEAVRRMGRGVARRPLLAAGDAVSALSALHDRRREAYEAVADVTVDTADAPRSEVLARVLRAIDSTEPATTPTTNSATEST